LTNSDVSADRPVELLGQLVGALSKQRQALAESDWSALNEVIPQLQDVVFSISQYPGGIEGLRAELAGLSEELRSGVNESLEAAAVDRKASAELIKINLQRFYALRSIHAVSASEDTYGQDSLSPRPGLKLSTRV
jgi:hypothetical protein